MVVAFTPVEDAQSSSVVPWGMVEKAASDFFREEWVEEPGITTPTEGLEEVVVLMETVEVVEVEEATLEEAVGITKMTPVGEVEDLIMLEKINKMNAVTIQLDMVK